MDLFALTDLATPWCIHVVSTLRIADHIEDGTSDIATLARLARCDPDSLARVLRHLVNKGVIEEPEPGHFALNDISRGLLDPSVRLALDLEGLGGRMAGAWSGLLDSVRTGRAAYLSVFGRSFWEDLDANPAVAESFDAMMGPAGHGVPDPDVLVGGDWEAVQTVVDVGGGTGAMLAEILRARPGVRGTLVDVPRALARSDEVFQAAGVTSRVTAIGQSFFDPLPVGADLYLLKNVLADWPDAEAAALLRRCAEAARPDGRVVILGGVSPDDPRGPAPDLLMLVLVGGKARTLSQFSALADGAGLRVVATGWQPTGRFLVECRPV